MTCPYGPSIRYFQYASFLTMIFYATVYEYFEVSRGVSGVRCSHPSISSFQIIWKYMIMFPKKAKSAMVFFLQSFIRALPFVSAKKKEKEKQTSS